MIESIITCSEPHNQNWVGAWRRMKYNVLKMSPHDHNNTIFTLYKFTQIYIQSSMINNVQRTHSWSWLSVWIKTAENRTLPTIRNQFTWLTKLIALQQLRILDSVFMARKIFEAEFHLKKDNLVFAKGNIHWHWKTWHTLQYFWENCQTVRHWQSFSLYGMIGYQ